MKNPDINKQLEYFGFIANKTSPFLSILFPFYQSLLQRVQVGNTNRLGAYSGYYYEQSEYKTNSE